MNSVMYSSLLSFSEYFYLAELIKKNIFEG
jgi:hypothetical protein